MESAGQYGHGHRHGHGRGTDNDYLPDDATTDVAAVHDDAAAAAYDAAVIDAASVEPANRHAGNTGAVQDAHGEYDGA